MRDRVAKGASMTPVSELTAHLGYLLRVVSNAVSHEFARAIAGEGVTVAEWVMLRSLYGEIEMAPSMLAARMGMTKGAISKLADRLVAKQLIERHENPADRRGHKLSLSSAGADKVRGLAALADANDAGFFGALRDGERAALRALLETLIAQRGLSRIPLD